MCPDRHVIVEVWTPQDVGWSDQGANAVTQRADSFAQQVRCDYAPVELCHTRLQPRGGRWVREDVIDRAAERGRIVGPNQPDPGKLAEPADRGRDHRDAGG